VTAAELIGLPAVTLIEQYIDGQAEAVQAPLRELYVALKAALPQAQERISYQMPTFWQGRNLIHFAAFRRWLGLFPGGEATTVFADRLIGYSTSKGDIRIPYGQPLPVSLVQDIARWCEAKNSAQTAASARPTEFLEEQAASPTAEVSR